MLILSLLLRTGVAAPIAPAEEIQPVATPNDSEPPSAPEEREQEGPSPTPSLEPDLPQSAEIESIVREEAATPRRLRYKITLAVREVYDDNVNLDQTNREDDAYTSIEPTISLGMGDPDTNFFNLTYSPNAFLFVNHSENNALQHVILLAGQYRFPLLTLTLSQDIQILDGTGLSSPTGTGGNFTRTNLDVAGRTRVNIYTTHLGANYSLTGKTFLTGGVSYGVSDYASLISSSVLSGNLYLNYTYSPKLTIGLGFAGGFNFVDSPSQDQTYEQINARASYELTGKVSATLSAGVEFRQISGSDESDNGSPVFDGTLFYQPFDGTSLSLSLSRRTQNSATLAAQNFHSTSVIFSARQRFLQRVYVGLTVGYENSAYFSTLGNIASDRSDDYYFLQGSLDLNLTSYWVVGIFYFYREDNSSLDAFSFYDNQFGIQSSVTF